MKRLPYLLPALGLFLTLSMSAQVHRPARSDDPAATPRVKATSVARSTVDPETGRRPAVVILNEPSLSDGLVASEPHVASVVTGNSSGGKPSVNTARIRERMFSADGETRLAAIR